MVQAIYGDLYFAVNLTMDTLSLYLTAKLLHLPIRLWRFTLAGALGALYSVASLILPDGNPLAAATALLIPILICLVSFGWQNTRSLLRQLGAFWLLSLLLGGIMTAVCYSVGVWGEKQVSVGGEVQPLMGDLPFWGLLLFALLAGGLITFLLKRRKPAAVTTEVTVEEQTSVSLCALIDSGNLLTEPISGLPVIVIDRAQADALLPDELRFLAARAASGGLFGARIPEGASVRLRLIPCTTASGESMLYGFIPKRLWVAGQPREACIAIGNLPQNADYVAIVPSNLL